MASYETEAIETRLNCLGFFGFGGGWALAKGLTARGETLYCNRCPLNRECWEKHKARVSALLPALTEEFEKMAAEVLGSELVMRFHEKFNTLDPYSRVLGANLADGINIATVGTPIDRGAWATIPWPFLTH